MEESAGKENGAQLGGGKLAMQILFAGREEWDVGRKSRCRIENFQWWYRKSDRGMGFFF
jgi:hypothetical protein